MKSKTTRLIDRRSFIGHGAAALGVLGGGLLAMGASRSARGASASPVVETASGRIRGTVNDRVYAFRGVPYGASTAGAGRFMPPAKPQPWTGVRDAIELGLRAPQQFAGGEPPEVAAMDRREPMGEDCLVLNVWTNGLNDGTKRPVMVWLHGGGFTSGSAGFLIYDGANLARRHDVVVVGVNHRLNAFGYLHLADLGGEKYARSTNVGHLDIVQALEWIRDNIERFGGDPNNVTVFGQSGGGRKVSVLQAMPAARGLFHRAIMQSGSALRGMERDAANEQAERLLRAVGLGKDRIDELQRMPYAQIVEAMAKERINFTAVVDGRTLPRHMFDPTAPEHSASVPILLGVTETEDAWSPRIQIDPIDANELHRRIKETIRVSDADAHRLIEVYQRKYRGIENIDVYLKMLTDDTRRTEAITMADRKAALGRGPAYMYFFTWRSPVRDGKMKAYHTLEIPFVFGNVDVAQSMTGTGRDRYPLQDRMMAAWAAFARTGNPNHPGLPSWPAYDAQNKQTMFFGNECRVVNDPNREERLALASVQRLT